MTRSHPRSVSGALLAVALAAAGAPASAQQPQARLLGSDPSGIHDLGAQNRLEISGVAGTVAVRPGKPGQLRYMARVRDNRREEHPIDLWLDGERTLRLAPPAGAEATELIVEVAVSPGVALVIDGVEGSSYQVSGLHGDLEVRGRGLKVTSRGVQGAQALDLQGGTLALTGAVGPLELTATKTEVELGQLQGDVVLALTGGRAQIEALGGRLSGELDGVKLDLQTAEGGVDLGASGSQLALHDMRRGARLELRETSLRLSTSRGPIEIDTDAPMSFQELDADLELTAWDGHVTGTGSRGRLRLHGNGTRIDLDNMIGPVEVDGDRLQLSIKRAKETVKVTSTSSAVVLEDVEGAVTLQNDFGETRVQRASGLVRIVSSSGNVQALELRGPLELSADGDRVEVSWLGLDGNRDSVIENARGDVHVAFGGGVSARLEAESTGGTVASSLDGIDVGPDGSRAAGTLGPNARATVTVKAGGDLVIAAAADPAPSPAGAAADR